VADDDHGVRITADIVLEPQRSFEIEIVGRLVQEQQIGLGKKDRGKRHAHAPATGKGGGGAFLRLVVEAETGENACRARFRRMGADVGEPRLDLGDPVRIDRRFRLRDERRAFPVGLEHDFDQRFFRPRRFLCDLSDPRVLRQGNTAGFRRKLAGDDPEQSRLAGAVASDEPGLRARRKRHGSVIDEQTARNAGGEAGYLDHPGLLPGLFREGKRLAPLLPRSLE
jgi:hypothetical protein